MLPGAHSRRLLGRVHRIRCFELRGYDHGTSSSGTGRRDSYPIRSGSRLQSVGWTLAVPDDPRRRGVAHITLTAGRHRRPHRIDLRAPRRHAPTCPGRPDRRDLRGSPRARAQIGFAGLLGQLGAVLPELRVAGSIEPALVSTLSPALQRLRDDATNPRLDDLADLVGMDRFQLIREMKRATGLSPLAWRQNTRVLEARRRLRAGERIADTAHSLGFVDQSHFHRVFQAHVAASPGAYRRRRNFVQDPPTT